jgi:thiamine biosynthesis lipoprotein
MGVEARIVLYAADEERAFDAAARAFARLADLNQRLSDYIATSELNRVAAGPVGATQQVSRDLARVLNAAKQMHAKTDGAFDITIGAASRLWRAARDSGVASDPAAIAAAREAMDMRAILVDEASGTVTMMRAGLSLDLGGIAKGYAAQQALATLREAGVARAMVALAGDIALGDAPPDAREGWRIAVGAAGSDGHELVLRNACVSTSGSSRQFVEIDGTRLSHIIDPRTGVGSRSVATVTVIGPDGALVDALATALCIVAAAERAKIAGRFAGFRVIVSE